MSTVMGAYGSWSCPCGRLNSYGYVLSSPPAELRCPCGNVMLVGWQGWLSPGPGFKGPERVNILTGGTAPWTERPGTMLVESWAGEVGV